MPSLGGLGVAGDIAGILGLILSGIALFHHGDAPIILLGTYLVVLNVVLAGAMTIGQSRQRDEIAAKDVIISTKNHELTVLARKAKVADALPNLDLVLARHAAAVESGNAESFQAHTQSALAAMAQIFTGLTGQPCRATLKEVYSLDPGAAGAGAPDLAVKTVCSSVDEPYGHSASSQIDRISENTDFAAVARGEDFFFCNDLVALMKEGLYRNSHWTEDVVRNERFHYRSTIVWPVLGRGTKGGAPMRLAGFLCVDTKAVDVFVDADVGMGAPVAAVLYASLTRYSDDEPNEPPDERLQGTDLERAIEDVRGER